MLKRIISLATLLFILAAAVYSQKTGSEVIYLNADINRTYAGSGSNAVVGYPPVSDIWIMHNDAIYRPSRAYHFIYGSFNYSMVPVNYVNVKDPYYKYMHMHHYYEEASLARADLSVTNRSVVKYRNYVRPSERTDYTEVNYLVPAPVVTSRTNTIVQPIGVVYHTAKTKQQPIRDFRTEVWKYKTYDNTAQNRAIYYSTLEQLNN